MIQQLYCAPDAITIFLHADVNGRLDLKAPCCVHICEGLRSWLADMLPADLGFTVSIDTALRRLKRIRGSTARNPALASRFLQVICYLCSFVLFPLQIYRPASAANLHQLPLASTAFGMPACSLCPVLHDIAGNASSRLGLQCHKFDASLWRLFDVACTYRYAASWATVSRQLLHTVLPPPAVASKLWRHQRPATQGACRIFAQHHIPHLLLLRCAACLPLTVAPR